MKIAPSVEVLRISHVESFNPETGDAVVYVGNLKFVVLATAEALEGRRVFRPAFMVRRKL